MTHFPKALIVSEENDISTLKVISYMIKNNTEFVRINDNDKIGELFLFLSNDMVFEIKSQTIDLKSIKAIWLRRGQIRFAKGQMLSDEKLITEYMNFFIEKSNKAIGNLFSEYNHNKLIDIEIARKNKIKTPLSFIISTKDQFQSILKNTNKSFITKSVATDSVIKFKGKFYKSDLTSLIDVESFVHGFFYPLFIQENIKKKFEIRTFFIKDAFYSMAIFSQNNSKTKVDYRNYDHNKPNRMIPFKIPINIENKLRRLIKQLGINTCSVDLIYSKSNSFIFLEINRMGQFDWLSGVCNYYIEKQISELLCKNS